MKRPAAAPPVIEEDVKAAAEKVAAGKAATEKVDTENVATEKAATEQACGDVTSSSGSDGSDFDMYEACSCSTTGTL